MFSDPVKNLSRFGIQYGMKIADLGCGSGHYSLAAAPLVGAAGAVYAVDVQKELLSRLKSEAESKKISNIEVIWGDIEEPGGSMIANEGVDKVILSNVLFQAEDKSGVVKEVKRILKAGGEALVVDWSDAPGALGPKNHVVPVAEAESLFESVGLRFVRDFSAGDHHYGFIVRK